MEAELKRQGITRQHLAEILKINIATVSAKLNKPNRLSLEEAMAIQKAFFPTLEISYLFETHYQTA